MPPRETAARAILDEIGLWTVLAPYNPTLTGTIPLDVDLPDSDLDVICHAADLDAFANLVAQHYETFPEFTAWQRDEARVANFRTISHYPPEFPAGARIEIYAEARPVETQYAWRHMRIERQLLKTANDPAAARAAIRALKRSGLSTEAAFCKYFAIESYGDPYAALLKLERP